MKQRTAIARTLVIDPKILLMDEPFGARRRDPPPHAERAARDFGRAAQLRDFVIHDVQEAVSLADRVPVMTAQ
jgi:ABC-type nitrate/sulfonate/bicarbonate transport system ATPase subunit